jgi:hypothetical protein
MSFFTHLFFPLFSKWLVFLSSVHSEKIYLQYSLCLCIHSWFLEWMWEMWRYSHLHSDIRFFSTMIFFICAKETRITEEPDTVFILIWLFFIVSPSVFSHELENWRLWHFHVFIGFSLSENPSMNLKGTKKSKVFNIVFTYIAFPLRHEFFHVLEWLGRTKSFIKLFTFIHSQFFLQYFFHVFEEICDDWGPYHTVYIALFFPEDELFHAFEGKKDKWRVYYISYIHRIFKFFSIISSFV